MWLGEGVEIGAVDNVEGPAFIGNNCKIAPDAVIGPYTVLSQGVTVRDRGRVERSVVDAGTYIGRATVIEGAILGRALDIRDHVRVHEGAAIGDEVTIGAEASVMPGVRIYPFKEVETGAQIHESIVWESRATRRLFARDGITGLVNVDLTPETAVRVAAALGTALDRGARVVASRDSADACRMVQRALIAGLTSTGVNVADLRVSPGSVTRHVLKTQGLGAGVHVGQSASDPELVEIRIFEPPGIQLTPGLQKEIEKHFTRRELRRASFAEIGDTTYPARVRESYAQDLLDTLDTGAVLARGIRIAIDIGYSAATYTLPLVLGPLGVEPVTINGFFTADVRAEPSVDAARQLVTAVGADLGVVFDRSAERLFLIDELGEEVPVDRTLLLFVHLLAAAGRTGSIAVPVTTTGLVEELVQGSGLRVVRTTHSLSDLTRAAAADGRRLRRRHHRRLRVPRRRTGIRRRHEPLQAARAARDREAAGLGARRGSACADARTTLGAVPLGPQGARHAPPQRTARRQGAGSSGRHQGVRRAWWVQAIPDPDEPLVHVFAEGDSDAVSLELADELEAEVVAIVQGDAVTGRTGM